MSTARHISVPAPITGSWRAAASPLPRHACRDSWAATARSESWHSCSTLGRAPAPLLQPAAAAAVVGAVGVLRLLLLLLPSHVAAAGQAGNMGQAQAGRQHGSKAAAAAATIPCRRCRDRQATWVRHRQAQAGNMGQGCCCCCYHPVSPLQGQAGNMGQAQAGRQWVKAAAAAATILCRR